MNRELSPSIDNAAAAHMSGWVFRRAISLRRTTRFRDPGVLQIHNLPFFIALFSNDGWPRLKFARSSAFEKLQILPEGNDSDIGTKEANLLHAVANAAAFVDGTEDHPVSGGDCGTPGVIPAQDVNEISVLRKCLGKAV